MASTAARTWVMPRRLPSQSNLHPQQTTAGRAVAGVGAPSVAQTMTIRITERHSREADAVQTRTTTWRSPQGRIPAAYSFSRPRRRLEPAVQRRQPATRWSLGAAAAALTGHQ